MPEIARLKKIRPVDQAALNRPVYAEVKKLAKDLTDRK